MQYIGIQGILAIISHMTFIAFSFRALQALRLDQILKKNMIFESRLLYLFLAVTIGYTCSSFFLSILENAHNLIYLF